MKVYVGEMRGVPVNPEFTGMCIMGDHSYSRSKAGGLGSK